MKKRIQAFVFLLFLISSFLLSATVHAEDNPESEWVLKEVLDYDGQEKIKIANENTTVYQYSVSYAASSFQFKWSYLGESDDYYDPPVVNGEGASEKAVFGAPPSSFHAGDTVSFSISVSITEDNLSFYNSNCYASASFDKYDIEPGFSTREGISFTDDVGEYGFRTDALNGPTSINKTISAVAPSGSQEGDLIGIHQTASNGVSIGTTYVYEWHPAPAPIVTADADAENINSTIPEDTNPYDGDESGDGEEDSEEESSEEELPVGKINVDIHTTASEKAEEVGASIPTVIVLGALGVIAAVAGAAGAAGTATGGVADAGTLSDNEESGKEGHSTYKMYVYKDFGNKIKYGGDSVFVYARMSETTKEGVELERLDLTQQIRIYSSDSFLQVGPSLISGAYMGALVEALKSSGDTLSSEGTIIFQYSGEGGTFRDHMKFLMTEECRIELSGQNLFILASSGRRFELAYDLVDFVKDAEVTVQAMQKDCPAALSVGKNKDGKNVITAIDNGVQQPFEKFFYNYNCEIIAQNDVESARSVFDIVLCYEGLLPDFLGKPKEIRGYKNNSGEMEETLIAFKLGIWNEMDQTLDLVIPQDLSVNAEDPGGILKVIGLEYEPLEDSVRTDAIIYRFQSQISFPSYEVVSGNLISSCNYNGKSYENDTSISLIPDIQEYSDNLEQEYERCKYIIHTYLPEDWRGKKLEQLEKSMSGFGVRDYQLFRKECWQFAERLIMQEKESYLQQSYAADEAIAYLEIYVYIGDVAFDIALMPVGGPIAGFLIGQVKSILLELISMKIEKGQISYSEMLEYIVMQFTGSADGLIEMPKPNDRRKLALWLSGFFLYRFTWHLYWDKDENGCPAGLSSAIENAVKDFAGKAVAGMMGNYIEEVAKNSKFVSLSQKVYNKDADEELMKSVTDLGDKVFENVDKASEKGLKSLIGEKNLHNLDGVVDTLQDSMASMVSMLEDFMNSIKNGTW